MAILYIYFVQHSFNAQSQFALKSFTSQRDFFFDDENVLKIPLFVFHLVMGQALPNPY